MAITVTGRKINVTPAIKDYVDEKISRALEVFDSTVIDAEVVLRAERNPANPLRAICEVTVNAKGAVIRVSESEEDMYAAIDVASDKVARRLRKYKTKLIDRRGSKNTIRHLEPEHFDMPVVEVAEDDDDLLVRVKEVEMEPMTEEHALVQTDLLDHDFFVYFDQDTHQIQVVYHRKNGGYGIIRPIINA